MSPMDTSWQKRLMLGMVPVAGLVLAVGGWSLVSSRNSAPPVVPTPAAVAQQPVPKQPPQEKPVEKPVEPAADKVYRRWLPEDARLLVQLRLSRLAQSKEYGQVASVLQPVWQPVIGQTLQALGLKAETIRQLSWAATDLADWPGHSVLVIQLDANQDAGVLRSLGEPVDLQLDAAPCRRLASGWTHPFAVLDAQTIVTGREVLLRQLATGGEKKLKLAALERFLQTARRDSDLMLVADLASARQAGWPLPTALVDVWPARRKAWRLVWETPQMLGLTVRLGDPATSDLAIVCEGETAADQVQAAMGELVPAAKTAVDGQLKLLPERIQSGQMAAATAKSYESVLHRARSVFQGAHWQVVEDTVCVRIDWGSDAAAMAKAVLDSRPALRSDWLQAALAADEVNSRRLLTGLSEHCRAQGALPAGAAGGSLLPPETRLSWIATMLPYYGHQDWHRELQFGYSWNSPQNRSVTRRSLEQVVNPALGPNSTEAGFPVTHYVGLAGVGEDAAELKPGDPRAGLFGHNRAARPQDIPDGASNTIALLGVQDRPGAWASGGSPTVRALTKRPYVNGPDGFGSGQPDGMLVGMADGAVRFVSKDVDPTVLEQLATAGGKETATVAALDARPGAVPGPKPPSDSKPAKDREIGSKDSASRAKPDLAGPAVAATPDQKAELEARLAAPIPELALPDIAFRDAINLVSQMSGLPITLDVEALGELGVTLDDHVTLRLANTTLGAALERVASSRGLVSVVQDGQLLVTSPAKHRSTLQTARYSVSDLTGQNPVAIAELAELVQKLVAPDSWKTAGGRGTVQVDSAALVVIQTAPVHQQVVAFCEKLRLARGKPLRSAHDPGAFSLATRLAQARTKLEQAVTVNIPEPTPLARIVADLEEASGVRILINHLALSAAGLSAQTTATLKINQQPLSQALESLLQPQGLACRVVDRQTLEITSAKALNAHLEVGFFPVGELVDRGLAAPALLDRIQGEVAGASWTEAGGPGVLYLDQPSRCLIVLQSQSVQAMLEAALTRWAKDK